MIDRITLLKKDTEKPEITSLIFLNLKLNYDNQYLSVSDLEKKVKTRLRVDKSLVIVGFGRFWQRVS